MQLMYLRTCHPVFELAIVIETTRTIMIAEAYYVAEFPTGDVLVEYLDEFLRFLTRCVVFA